MTIEAALGFAGWPLGLGLEFGGVGARRWVALSDSNRLGRELEEEAVVDGNMAGRSMMDGVTPVQGWRAR